MDQPPSIINTPKPPAIVGNWAMPTKIARAVAGAALGDLEAQRALCKTIALELLHTGQPLCDAQFTALYAIMFGRIAASHGHVQDIRALAVTLIMGSDVMRALGRGDLAGQMKVEGIYILERLAEDGDELAASSTAALIENESPDFAARVASLRRQIEEDEGTDQ